MRQLCNLTRAICRYVCMYSSIYLKVRSFLFFEQWYIFLKNVFCCFRRDARLTEKDPQPYLKEIDEYRVMLSKKHLTLVSSFYGVLVGAWVSDRLITKEQLKNNPNKTKKTWFFIVWRFIWELFLQLLSMIIAIILSGSDLCWSTAGFNLLHTPLALNTTPDENWS